MLWSSVTRQDVDGSSVSASPEKHVGLNLVGSSEQTKLCIDRFCAHCRTQSDGGLDTGYELRFLARCERGPCRYTPRSSVSDRELLEALNGNLATALYGSPPGITDVPRDSLPP
jgi:hypothetical protein